MQPGVGNSSQRENNENDEGNDTSETISSHQSRDNQPTQEQSLQGDAGARHGPRRRRSRRRGRRRGRRRRRGQQRARARARAREEAQIALAEISEDSGSSADESDNEDNLFRDRWGSIGSAGSARSRSPRRQRSLDNDDFLRRGIAGIRPTVTPPRLQPSPCRVPNCDWSGPLDGAADHARATHTDAILRGPRQRLSVPLTCAAYTRYWRLIDAFDELFLVQFRRRAGGRRRLQAAVQLVGPASRAARFLYLLHMQVEEAPDQTDPLSSTPQQTTSPRSSTPPVPSTTRISLILGQTSSTRVDLEPAMISLWSANNFSQTQSSLQNVSPCLPFLQTEDIICPNTSAPRILDLSLSIQCILDQKD